MQDRQQSYLIDALVPCHNEAKRVGKVLATLRASKYINNIIFVDDASIDESLAVARKIPNIRILSLSKNIGKGDAVKAGAAYVRSPAVFLCDADISGLNETHISQLLTAYWQQPRAMVVGLREKAPFKVVHYLRTMLPLIAGERLLPTEDLRRIVQDPTISEYGLEPYMNYYFTSQGRPIIKLLLEGVNDLPKWKKESYGFAEYFAEYLNISQKYTSIYTQQAPKVFLQNIKSLFLEE